MMNPYLSPGLEATPYAPLCPYLYQDHDELYVPIDDTDREFRRFQDTMNSLGSLTAGGRLVVVTGKQGCGKTSLINRCAAWLRDELPRAQLIGEILALTDAAALDQSIMFRMEQVLRDLVYNLRDEQRGVETSHISVLENLIREVEDTPDTIDRQSRHGARVGRVYRYLHDALPDNRIAIILLPASSELFNEIKSYLDFARHPRVVFFAETSFVEDVDRILQTTRTNDRRPPIQLKVGPLHPGDGWIYAQARQENGSTDAIFPPVSEETMRRVALKGVPIGRLHKTLYDFYEDLAPQGTARDPLPLREVSYQDITDYIYRSTVGASGNMP